VEVKLYTMYTTTAGPRVSVKQRQRHADQFRKLGLHAYESVYDSNKLENQAVYGRASMSES